MRMTSCSRLADLAQSATTSPALPRTISHPRQPDVEPSRNDDPDTLLPQDIEELGIRLVVGDQSVHAFHRG